MKGFSPSGFYQCYKTRLKVFAMRPSLHTEAVAPQSVRVSGQMASFGFQCNIFTPHSHATLFLGFFPLLHTSLGWKHWVFSWVIGLKVTSWWSSKTRMEVRPSQTLPKGVLQNYMGQPPETPTKENFSRLRYLFFLPVSRHNVTGYLQSPTSLYSGLACAKLWASWSYWSCFQHGLDPMVSHSSLPSEIITKILNKFDSNFSKLLMHDTWSRVFGSHNKIFFFYANR